MARARDTFFERRRPAAVFKHGIVKRYPPVFASKAGSLTNGRAVFLDGYGGAGRYDDGAPGSPLLLVAGAEYVQKWRSVTVVVVENNPRNFRKLQNAVGTTSGEVDVHLYRGDVSDHLPKIIALSAGTALFAFLDPYGPALDRHQLVDDLLRRPGRAPTEILLHFSVRTVARRGGIVRKAHENRREFLPGERRLIDRLDRFLGGQWWHSLFIEPRDTHDHLDTDLALTIAERYSEGIRRQTGFEYVTMPVRFEPDRLPTYVLTLFTRSPHGAWQFADALGKAGRDWHEAYHEERLYRARRADRKSGNEDLFGTGPLVPFDKDGYERRNRDLWITVIRENIERILARGRRIRLSEHVVDVYGATLGQAWIPHVRAAVRHLHNAGLIDHDGRGEFQNDLISRRPIAR